MKNHVCWKSLERIAVSGALKCDDRVLEIGAPGEAKIPEAGMAWFSDQIVSNRKDEKFAPSGPASSTFGVKALLENAGIEHELVRVPDDLESLEFRLENPEDRWDAVLNFGAATSHLDQMGLFRAMHEAIKPTGYLCHSVPAGGENTRSWFNCNPRLFLDTAVSNRYDLIDYAVEPVGSDSPFDHAFRNDDWAVGVDGSGLKQLEIQPEIDQVSLPPMILTVICRKTRTDSFQGAIETQTSVGEIPESVSTQYGSQRGSKADARLRRRIARLEKELTAIKDSARKSLRVLESIRRKIEE